MINPDGLLTATEFRALSAYFKQQRREAALPDLKAQEYTLKRDLGRMYRKLDNAYTSHEKQRIESDMKPLQWDYQFVAGQIAIIESEPLTVDVDALPERWRVQVFEVGKVA